MAFDGVSFSELKKNSLGRRRLAEKAKKHHVLHLLRKWSVASMASSGR